MPWSGWRLFLCRISRASAAPITLMLKIVRRIRRGSKPAGAGSAWVFVVLCALLASIAQTQCAQAQIAIPEESAVVANDPALLMSRDQWKAHVNDIKRRIRDSAAINLLRSRKTSHPTPGELSREATERVLRDYSLVSGDLVMTDRGLLVFRGRAGEEPKEADFEKVSDDAVISRRQPGR
jgi:hypothetical protein